MSSLSSSWSGRRCTVRTCSASSAGLRSDHGSPRSTTSVAAHPRTSRRSRPLASLPRSVASHGLRRTGRPLRWAWRQEGMTCRVAHRTARPVTPALTGRGPIRATHRRDRSTVAAPDIRHPASRLQVRRRSDSRRTPSPTRCRHVDRKARRGLPAPVVVRPARVHQPMAHPPGGAQPPNHPRRPGGPRHLAPARRRSLPPMTSRRPGSARTGTADPFRAWASWCPSTAWRASVTSRTRLAGSPGCPTSPGRGLFKTSASSHSDVLAGTRR